MKLLPKSIKRRLDLSPAAKVVAGLIMIMLSVLIVAQAIGLVPDSRIGTLEARKTLTESLALQTSILASNGNNDLLEGMLEATLKRDESLKSIGMRLESGELDIDIGGHGSHWALSRDESSTTENIRVPVLKDGEVWANVELAFEPINDASWIPWPLNSFIVLLLLSALLCGLGYWLYVKRIIRELNPSQAIPEEVRAAYDSLSEGVLILNGYDEIVLANKALCKILNTIPDNLYGELSEDLPWEVETSLEENETPWNAAMREKEPILRAEVKVRQGDDVRTVIVNSSPILDDYDDVKGIINTFDDITDMVAATEAHEQVNGELQNTRAAMRTQSAEIESLSQQDSLTGSLNRKTFLQTVATLVRSDHDEDKIFLVLVDVDHFKSLNDTYGFTLGDEVLHWFANRMQSLVGNEVSVGRLEGDQFGLLLTLADAVRAKKLVDALIAKIAKDTPIESHASLHIGISAGICEHQAGQSTESLFANAETALKTSKMVGRGRATVWRPEMSAANAA